MNTKLFLEAMNDIDDKYLKQSDRFASPVRESSPDHIGPLQVIGMLTAAFLVVTGIWFIWGRSPNVGSTQPGYHGTIREVAPPLDMLNGVPFDETVTLPNSLTVYQTSDDMNPAFHADLSGGKDELSQNIRDYLQAYFDAAGILRDASEEEIVRDIDVSYTSEDGKLSISATLRWPNRINVIQETTAGEVEGFTEENLLELPLVQAALSQMGKTLGEPMVRKENIQFEQEMELYCITCPDTDLDSYLASRHFYNITIHLLRSAEADYAIALYLNRSRPDSLGSYITVPYQAALEYLQTTYPEECTGEIRCELDYAAFALDDNYSTFAPCYKFTLQNETGDFVHYISATEYEGEEITLYVQNEPETPDKTQSPEGNDTISGVSIDMDGQLIFRDPALQEIYNGVSDVPQVTTGQFYTDCTRTLSLAVPQTPVYQSDDQILLLMDKVEYGFFEESGQKTIRKTAEYSGPIAVDFIAETYESDTGTAFQTNGFWRPESGFRSSTLTEDDLNDLAGFMSLSRGEIDRLLAQAVLSEAKRNEALLTDLLLTYMDLNSMSGYSLWDEQSQDYLPITKEMINAALLRTDLSEQTIEHWKPDPKNYNEIVLTQEQKQALMDAPKEYVQFEAALRSFHVELEQLKITELTSDLNAMHIEYVFRLPDSSPEATEAHQVILQKNGDSWEPFSTGEGELILDLNGDGERDANAFRVDWDVLSAGLEDIAGAAWEIAREFVDNCLENPITQSQFSDGILTYLELKAVSQDRNSFLISVTVDFKPKGDEVALAGALKPDTGKWEGYYQWALEIRAKKTDEQWVIDSYGGGIFPTADEQEVNLMLLDDRT